MTTAAPPLEGPMSEPWHGSRPPEEPVTVTMPYRTAKRVLVAVVSDAQRANSRGKDPDGVEQLAAASDAIGDAIDAPPHRRFRLPERLYYAVIAGTEAEYRRWLDTPGQICPQPIFVDSVESALSACYSGYSTTGTAYRRDDFQEILAAVRARTFKR
jgi:hypothetical protein